MFDTLKYSRALEATGIARNQAEAHVRIIAEIFEGDLVTKSDIKHLEHKLVELEYRLIIRLGALVTVVVATAVTILKLT